jgi:hypothetical protein
MPRLIRLCFIIISLFCLIGCFDSSCGNETMEQKLSPGHKLKLVKFNRDCGATTSGSIQISILDAGDSLTNSAGNIFISDFDSVDVNWLDNKSILIKHRQGLNIFKAENSTGDFTIKYETFK